jgi:hypothetical protein
MKENDRKKGTEEKLKKESRKEYITPPLHK